MRLCSVYFSSDPPSNVAAFYGSLGPLSEPVGPLCRVLPRVAGPYDLSRTSGDPLPHVAACCRVLRVPTTSPEPVETLCRMLPRVAGP